MKILMQARGNIFKVPAGDTIQLLKTKEALEKLGQEVEVDLSPEVDLSGYHLVHCFNIITIQDTYPQIRNALNQECPIALSPIYWNMEEFFLQYYPGKISWWEEGKNKRILALEAAQLLLPNSKSESCQLRLDFKNSTPYQVVYNGVDPIFEDICGDDFVKEYGVKDFVLCVGRITPRKNQRGVIEALQETDLPLVFIGGISDQDYYRQCQQIAGSQVLFLPHLPQEQLKNAYGAARVHILASWFDTPGLVNLEAGLAGCNLVVSNRGTAHEYFGDLVWYCNPADLESIRTSVSEAYHSPLIPDLKRHLLRQFTWTHVGQSTLDAYTRLLHSRDLSRSI